MINEEQYTIDELQDEIGEELMVVSKQKMGELCREQAKMDGDVNLMGREKVVDQIDEWDVVDEARLKDVEYADGDVHAWFEYETTVRGHKTHARTRTDPACYERWNVLCEMSITWSMEAEDAPHVDIETRMN